jgi:hypothetical protein
MIETLRTQLTTLYAQRAQLDEQIRDTRCMIQGYEYAEQEKANAVEQDS